MYIIKRNIKIIGIIILVICLSIIIGIKYYLYDKKENIVTNKEKEITISKKKDKIEENDHKEKIFVDIKGAIKKPGVYEMDEDKKVIDVVYQAGGLSEEADTTYVNLAKNLIDEMVIIIYTKDQIKEAKKSELLSTESSGSCVCPKISNDACINNKNNSKTNSNSKNTTTKNNNQDKNTTNKTNELININTATKEELQTISGIGEGKAQAIIDYREENGNFNSIEDILNVSGIGESIYEKIKDSITV